MCRIIPRPINSLQSRGPSKALVYSCLPAHKTSSTTSTAIYAERNSLLPLCFGGSNNKALFARLFLFWKKTKFICSWFFDWAKKNSVISCRKNFVSCLITFCQRKVSKLLFFSSFLGPADVTFTKPVLDTTNQTRHALKFRGATNNFFGKRSQIQSPQSTKSLLTFWKSSQIHFVPKETFNPEKERTSNASKLKTDQKRRKN